MPELRAEYQISFFGQQAKEVIELFVMDHLAILRLLACINEFKKRKMFERIIKRIKQAREIKK